MKVNELNYPTHDFELNTIVFPLKICHISFMLSSIRCLLMKTWIWDNDVGWGD